MRDTSAHLCLEDTHSDGHTSVLVSDGGRSAHSSAPVGAAPAEQWRSVVGASDYQVSSFGRVRNVAGRRGTWAGRILRPRPSHGYLRVAICVDGERRDEPIHRLVCAAFNGPCPPGKSHVNHIDGRKRNNVPANLEWVSPHENAKHAAENGLLRPSLGERNGLAVLTESDVAAIFELRRSGLSQSAIGKKFGVGQGRISSVLRGATWAHVACDRAAARRAA